MPKTPVALLLVLGSALLAGCAGDDTVNPLPPPEAGTDASKDAKASDGASPREAGPDATADATPDGD